MSERAKPTAILEPPTDWRPFDPAEEYGPDLYVLGAPNGASVLALPSIKEDGIHTAWAGQFGPLKSGDWLYPVSNWQIFGPITLPEWGEE